MQTNKKKKVFLISIVVIVVILLGIFTVWAKRYYEDRYVASDVFYTQIPLDENNETSWLYNAEGKAMQEGKDYVLNGYNKNGQERELAFFVVGTEKDYYPAGTYLKIEVSKEVVLGQTIVKENTIPTEALKEIQTKGTKISA